MFSLDSYQHPTPRRKIERHQRPRFYLRAFLSAALVSSSLLAWSPSTLAGTQASTIIRNKAVGVFEDPDNGKQTPVVSNEVTLTVAEITGITVMNAGVTEAPIGVNNAGPNQGNGSISTGDVIYFQFVLSNVGNDPTQFFLPDTLSALSGGTQAGDIQIVTYDADGSGPIAAIDLTSANIQVPAGGQTTGVLLNGVTGANNGSVPMDGTITIRVPIKITAIADQTVSATLGNTDARPNTQNVPYLPATPATDLYTVDNLGTANGDTDGDPLNGDATLHRQEASTTQALNLLILNTNISGLVWKDDNFDGIRQVTETMLDGVTVELFDANGVSQGTRKTSGGGRYEFINLPPGEYTAEFTPLPKYVLTLQDRGTDGTLDSDAKPVTNRTNPITAGSGAANDRIDVGMSPDSDSDTATDFKEGTGDRDGDGIPNYLDFDPTGYFYDEATGQIIPGGRMTISGTGATQLSIPYDGSLGYYQWIGEAPGIYTMTITPPPGYALSDTCTLRPPTDILDPTGGPDPTIIGTYQNGTTGFMLNMSCARSYLAFDLAPGDPVVINNNIPLKRLPPLTCSVGGGIPDATISPFISAEVRRDVIATRPLVDTLDDSWRAAVGQPADPPLAGWYGKSTAPSGSANTFTYRDPIAATTMGVSVDLVQVPISSPANCIGEARTAGSAPAVSFSGALQSSSPRPASLYESVDQPGFWNETGGGASADGKRNAVRFTFDQPVKAFGAWFGDLETRTDGNGTPAILRLLDAAGNRIGADIAIAPSTMYDAIAPDPETVNQTLCGGTTNTEPGCGNQSTRWVSFVDNTAIPRVKHVLVIVGDDDSTAGDNDGDSEHLSFIGANMVPATTSTANLLLVKRITAINGDSTQNPNDNTPLNVFVDDSTTNDNNINWPNPTSGTPPISTVLRGAIDAGKAKPGDTIEYTIYFLSAGTVTARAVQLCDRIPSHQAFIPDSFNSLTVAPNTTPVLPIGDRGIEVSQGSTIYGYTNIGDGDAARYYPPGSPLPSACTQTGSTEDNGTVVVNLGDVPNATAPGSPVDSYGFLRFRARVK
jgi:uncharacterized repeat protein (TIGR01451 family)